MPRKETKAQRGHTAYSKRVRKGTHISQVQNLCFCLSAAAAKSLQSCPTLCDPIDGSSTIPGIL